MSERKVRMGLIGYGGIGIAHGQTLSKNVPNIELVAICDHNPKQLERAKKECPGIKYYATVDEILADPEVEAVHIAVPHYDHPTIGIQALNAGKHTMIEKPAGVYGKQVLEINEVAAKSDKKFGIMLNLRAHPAYAKLHELITTQDIGAIKRITWTVTDWYRPQPYHVRNDWCSTWEGEGGGTLINQNPHNLDMWQWLFGVPDTITGFCEFGKYYDIDVEDEVVAHFKYKNGVTGVYITSTGEFPGTNLLEIACDRGVIMLHDNTRITFRRLDRSEREHNATTKTPFGGHPNIWECEIPVDMSTYAGHAPIFRDFAQSILDDSPLLAPGFEGIKPLTMSNAIHYSAWKGNVPVDVANFPHDEYYELLQEKIRTSKYPMRHNTDKEVADFSGTWK